MSRRHEHITERDIHIWDENLEKARKDKKRGRRREKWNSRKHPRKKNGEFKRKR